MYEVFLRELLEPLGIYDLSEEASAARRFSRWGPVWTR